MSRVQAMDASPEWIREEWEDILSCWAGECPEDLKGGEVLKIGPAFLRNGGRCLCCGLSRQAEHEFGTH